MKKSIVFLVILTLGIISCAKPEPSEEFVPNIKVLKISATKPDPNYLESSITTIGSKDLYTKKLTLKPKSSQSFLLKLDEGRIITVQIAGGDLGSGRIIAEVYDPNGNKVVSGANEFSFYTKNIKGNYKFVVTNNTENRQSVKVSLFLSVFDINNK